MVGFKIINIQSYVDTSSVETVVCILCRASVSVQHK